VPRSGTGAPLAGSGSIVVRNKGDDGKYAARSNSVPIEIR
jgi:hypothetical protein